MEKIIFDEIPDPDLDMKYRIFEPRIVSYVEKIVRSLYEYTELVYFIKNFLDINRCTFYQNYSMKSGFTIELHHAPLTLYEISEIIVKRELERNESIESFLVADMIVKEHYQFRVGLVPLSPTAHELVHDGKLFIHNDLIIGNWREFLRQNDEWVNGRVKNKISDIDQLSKKYAYDEFPQLLKYNPQQIEVKNQKSLLTYDTKKLIQNRNMKSIELIKAAN